MWKKFGSAILAAALPSAAHASGLTYDCDTAPGHFSELVLPAPSIAFTVTGNIKVNNIAKDKKWAPIARVRIGSAPPGPGQAPTVFSGFELTAVPGKAVQLSPETVQVFSFDTAGRDTELIPTSLQASGSVQPFSLSYDGRSVSVAVGAARQSFHLTANEPVVQIICSTGEFLLTDLIIQPSQ